MNYRVTAYVLGQISAIVGALMCIPLFMAIGYKEYSSAFGFGIAIAVAIVVGFLGVALRPAKDKRELRPSSGLIMCGLAWILIALIGAIPFRLSNAIPNYIDALFETVSGFTTTGASILSNVEALPRSMLFWRALTQWIGGMGVLVFVIAIMPKNDKTSTALAKAEQTGPQFGKLVSKLRFTTQILYAMYIVLTLILAAILCACKMPVFDSFCHAFATASTGGFSVKNASIAAYNSISIEVVITIFMLLFSVNFNVFYMILIGRVLKAVRNEEVTWFFIIYILTVVAITVSLCVSNTYASVAEALRYTSFNVASVMSTTGYATANFAAWPVLTQVLLLLVMCIGGCAGSTAGGMKVSRGLILCKSSIINVKKTLSPRSVYTLKMDGKPIGEDIVRNVQSFFILYVLIIAISTILISIEKFAAGEGISILETNLSAIISCVNNIGPGVGAVGPLGNFSEYGVFAKLVMCLDMLLGRLEILPILIIFYHKAWKKL